MYLFNVFFMFLELLRTALNTNINFSYISIYSSHLGTYWKSGLYFSVCSTSPQCSKAWYGILNLREAGWRKYRWTATGRDYYVLPIQWPLQKGWGCYGLRRKDRDGLWQSVTNSSSVVYSWYFWVLGLLPVLLSASYEQPSR